MPHRDTGLTASPTAMGIASNSLPIPAEFNIYRPRANGRPANHLRRRIAHRAHPLCDPIVLVGGTYAFQHVGSVRDDDYISNFIRPIRVYTINRWNVVSAEVVCNRNPKNGACFRNVQRHKFRSGYGDAILSRTHMSPKCSERSILAPKPLLGKQIFLVRLAICPHIRVALLFCSNTGCVALFFAAQRMTGTADATSSLPSRKFFCRFFLVATSAFFDHGLTFKSIAVSPELYTSCVKSNPYGTCGAALYLPGLKAEVSRAI